MATGSPQAPGDVYIKQLELGRMANYVYLVGSRSSRQVAVVDPAWEVEKILDETRAADLEITAILVSHHHSDHTNGVKALLERAPRAKLYVNRLDASSMPGVEDRAVKVTEGDRIRLGDIEIETLHTPGHTAGSQCFRFGDTLISGDTLFVRACGRCDVPGGNPEQMYSSLQRLAGLDRRTVVMPGHNYADRPTSTIEYELAHNIFFRMDLRTFKRFVRGPAQVSGR